MFWKNFVRLCNNRGVSPSGACEQMGFSRATATSWNRGAAPRGANLEKVADYFGVTAASLISDEEPEQRVQSSAAVRIPVLGSVAAGIPITAITDIEDWEEIPADVQGDFLALRIKGDSMAPRICDGDVVIVRHQETADNGQIAIVMVNGDEATCKRIRRTADGLTLLPLNPAYEPRFFSNAEIDGLPVRILGVVVELRAKF